MLEFIKKIYIPLITAAAAIFALSWIFIVPLGVSDGGSHYQTLERVGLFYSEFPQEGVVQMEYNSMTTERSSVTTQEHIITALKRIFDPFNLKYIAAFCSFILLAGLFFLVNGLGGDYTWHKWLAAALALLILCDFAYTTYFNSLYWEPIAISLIVLFAGLYASALRNGRFRAVYAVFLTITAIALSATSTIGAVVAVICGALIIILIALSIKPTQKIISAICGGLVIISGITFAFTYQAATYQKDLYNAVFFGVANQAPVAELGINPDLDQLKGVYYSPQLIESYNLEQELYSKVNYGNIAAFYITHPTSLWDMLNTSAGNGFNPRLAHLGNYTNPEKASKLADGFNLYSTLKNAVIPNTPIFVLLFFVVYFGVLVSAFVDKKAATDNKIAVLALVGLGISAIITFCMPFMQTGIVELGRTMIIFNLLFDLMVLFSITSGIVLALRKQKEAKEKYGISQ